MAVSNRCRMASFLCSCAAAVRATYRRVQAAVRGLVGVRQAWIHPGNTDFFERRPRPRSLLGNRSFASPCRVRRVGTDGAMLPDVANKRKKKETGTPAEASKRDRKVKPIPLRDLLPRQDVTGGRKSLFGTRDQETNRADGSTREE